MATKIRFQNILLVSRPARWLKTAAPFAIAYLATSQQFDLSFWLGLLYFCLSFNLALRGYRLLEKSDSSPARTSAMLWLILTNLPFLVYFLVYGTIPIKSASIIMVGLLLGYGVFNRWFAQKPFLKAISISLLFTLPLFFGLAWNSRAINYIAIILVAFAWCLASHSFATATFLLDDRKNHRQSIATRLGVKRSLALSFWIYSACALSIGLFYGINGLLVACLMAIYALNISFFTKYKSDAQSDKLKRGWYNWQWLNLIVGFWLTIILIHTIDPLHLGDSRIIFISYILIFVSLFQTLLIMHNLIGFARPKVNRINEWPKVSILIYSHNQADNIASTLLALIGQNYPELEIIFADIESSDNTLKIVEGYEDPRIKIVKIAPLRSGWTMHAHAAAELLSQANGELAILLSADTVLKPNAIANFASLMERKKLDLMSLLPADQNKTLAQKLILSQNQFFLLGIYPAAYLAKNYPKFASAYAGLIIFNRQKINSIGGFKLVKNSPLEDFDLASQVKINGLKTAFYLGSDIAVSQNHADLKLILRQTNRRLYPLLSFNMPFALCLISGGLFVFCAPFAMLIYQILYQNGASIIGLIAVLIIGLTNRLIVAIKTKQSRLGALLYPLTSLITILEIITSMLSYELLKPRWLERTEAH